VIRGDADLHRPATHAFGEERLAVAGFGAHDVMELAEQLERHGAEQCRPGHEPLLEQRVGDLRRDDGADWCERRPVVRRYLLVQRGRCEALGGDSVDQDAEEQVGDAGGGCDRGGRGDIAGYRGAVDEGVLVGIGQGPCPDSVADRRRAADEVVAGHGRLLGLGGDAQRVVGVDDQSGQQVVAAGDVAVDR